MNEEDSFYVRDANPLGRLGVPDVENLKIPG